MPVTSRPSPAVEDYAKAIYSLERSGGGAVTTSDLASRLGVSAASASGMVRRLGEMGLVEHEPYRGVVLTPKGEAIALEILRHHRLLELYLVEQLGMSWEEVHAEADRLEHVISEGLEDRIAAALGQPDRDPHGDPIPARDGTLPADPSRRLADAAPGAEVEILRVSDRDPRLLRYLAERGLVPGASARVAAVDELAGVITLDVGGADCTLALATAGEIDVRA